MTEAQQLEDHVLVALRSEDALMYSQSQALDIDDIVETYEKSWLCRLFVMITIRRELIRAGLLGRGKAIDWEAIGKFIVTIVPAIIEIIKLFM